MAIESPMRKAAPHERLWDLSMPNLAPLPGRPHEITQVDPAPSLAHAPRPIEHVNGTSQPSWGDVRFVDYMWRACRSFSNRAGVGTRRDYAPLYAHLTHTCTHTGPP